MGAIEESGTFPGPGAFSEPPRTSKAFITPGATAKSSISSLSRTPVPCPTTHDPKGSLTVVVSATAFPCASTTETCVVCAPSWVLTTCCAGMARSPIDSRSVRANSLEMIWRAIWAMAGLKSGSPQPSRCA